MKQKDLALIILVAFFAGLFAYFAVTKFIPNTKPKTEKAEEVEPITASFDLPAKYFTPQSINPTKTIQIGENNNSGPFSRQP